MDTSLVSARVVAVLAQLVQERGAPGVISVDSGSEFYSRSTDRWAYLARVRPDFSRLGETVENPFIESFNGHLRHEHLNTELFF